MYAPTIWLDQLWSGILIGSLDSAAQAMFANPRAEPAANAIDHCLVFFLNIALPPHGCLQTVWRRVSIRCGRQNMEKLHESFTFTDYLEQWMFHDERYPVLSGGKNDLFSLHNLDLLANGIGV